MHIQSPPRVSRKLHLRLATERETLVDKEMRENVLQSRIDGQCENAVSV